MSTSASTRLLTVAQVAARLDLHPVTVRRLIRQGEIPAVRLGSGKRSALRIPEDELDSWLYDDEGNPK